MDYKLNINHIESLIAVRLISLVSLKPTEKHNNDRVSDLAKDIVEIGFWSKPILIESSSLIIMDGHHRFQAAQLLKLSKIPCLMINYHNPYLKLSSRISGKDITPENIIEAGVQGELLDYKSTAHMLDIELITIKIPLEMLRI